MATNILHVLATDTDKVFPLRGDMSVSLDITPSATFAVTFVTYGPELYTLSSTTATFRQLDGSIMSTLVVGGQASLFFTLMFNTVDQTWDITSNNLVGSDGGSGSGSGLTPEVLIEQAEDGTIQFDAALGNNFRVVTSKDIRFISPIGYEGGNAYIRCTVVQGSTAPHLASYDKNFATQDQQPAVLAIQPNAINLLTFDATNDPKLGQVWITQSAPDKAYTVGFGPSTAIAYIGEKEYFQLGKPKGTLINGAMYDCLPGQTVEVVRNGRGPEATGLFLAAERNPADVFRIKGRPVGTGMERRPQLKLLPDTRPTYGKALLNFEGVGTTYVSDLRVDGARNEGNDARGLCHNDTGMNLVVNNVEITDCNNGILTGNAATTGDTIMTDVKIDKCGIGGPAPDLPSLNYSTVGFTHGVYFGHNPSTITMKRCSIINAIHGDNLKSRSARLIASQVDCSGSLEGRDLEIPNGGWVEMDNCIFWKKNQTGTGNLAMVGGNGGAPDTAEGLDTSRPRKYKFTNCLFRSDYATGGQGGRDAMLICLLDHEVSAEFIDCKFEGVVAENNSDDPNNKPIYAGTVTRNGIRYKPSAPPIFTLTGGPLGPILPVGYFPVGMANGQDS
jgi:hypothetical protein